MKKLIKRFQSTRRYMKHCGYSFRRAWFYAGLTL
jgi:hypothetical protein